MREDLLCRAGVGAAGHGETSGARGSVLKVNFEMAGEFEGQAEAPMEDPVQEAIDATAMAYADDAGIDVEQHLRAQLSSRGIEAHNEEWIAETGRRIRSGHRVSMGNQDGPLDRRSQ